MAFFFVDRVFEYEPFKRIRGVKNVTRNEQFFYWLPSGERVLSPAVITEALCQLGGWLNIVSTDFKKRAVLLADERTDYLGMVESGTQLELLVEVSEFGEDVVVSCGEARVNGAVVLRGHCTRGYLLDASEFDDPERTKRQWQGLYKPEFSDARLNAAQGQPLKAIAGGRTFEALRFIDGLVEHKPYEKVVGYKNFASCEPYFESHFPRKPCVPGVLLTTCIGEVCQYMIKENLEAPVRSRALVPLYTQNIRFRKYVEPGDQALIEAKLIKGDPRVQGSEIAVRAAVYANGQRAVQCEMGFITMLSPDLAADQRPKVFRP